MGIFRISDNESKVLAAVQLQADAPISLIAKQTSLKEHTVNYCLQNLNKKNLIEWRPIINLSLLGYTEYSIFLSILHDSKSAKENLIKSLIKSTQIGDLFEVGGDYSLGIVVCAKDIIEVQKVLSEFSKNNGIKIINKTLGIRVENCLFQRKYLANLKLPKNVVSFKRSEHQYKIDHIDKIILSGLANISHTSKRDLAKKLDISHSTLEIRIKKLKEEGILLGEVYGITTSLLGIIKFRILVHTKENTETIRDLMFTFASNNPKISVMIRIIGSWDFELLAEVFDSEEITSIIQQIHEILGDLALNVKAIPLFKFHNVSDFPF